MAVNLTVNGTAYAFPNTGDQTWGDNVTNWATAVTSGMLQKAGGAFTLTAEVDFGSTFGTKQAYLKTETANPSATGVIRLANNGDSVSWRNAANNADLALLVNASNQLTFAAGVLLTTTGTLTNNTVATVNGSGQIASASVTTTTLAFLDATSSIQTQLNAKQATGNYITSLTTDVVASGAGAAAATIQANVVTNAKLAQMGANTIKGNNTGGTANAADLTVAQTKAILNTAPTVQVLRSSGTGFGWIFNVRSMTATVGATYTNNGNTYTLLNTVSNGTVAYFSGSSAPQSSGTLTKSAGTGDATATFNSAQAFGTPVGFLFTVTSANATVGATYTNNGNTYTVAGTIAAGTKLWVTGASLPTLTGTLTKSGGSGDATITFSEIVPCATYTTPANALYLKIRGVGGGGGGAPAATNSGSPGTSSGFGVGMIVCNPGLAGLNSGLGNVGGAATLGTGPIGFAIQGGSSSDGAGAGGTNFSGTSGASSPFGGAGGGSAQVDARSAVPNTGSGGGGSSVSAEGFSGGGAGGYVDCMIANPAATYMYAIGLGGTGGVPGTHSGGDGGSGVFFVEEFYQ